MLLYFCLSLLLILDGHCQQFKGDVLGFLGPEVEHGSVEDFDYNYRLPGRVAPLHYKLEYVFDPDLLPKVKGSVEVRAEVLEPEEQGQTLLMEIHSHPTIESFLFDMVDPAPPNKKFKQDTVTFDPHKQIAIVPLPKNLNKDQVIKFNITFEISARNFTHPKDQDTLGLFEFRSEHSAHPIFLSSMQTNGARRMFPCWDEPKFKATYELKLALLKSLASDDLKVFTFTPVHDLEKSEEMKIYKFPTSLKKMPTYVFSFTIGEFPTKVCEEGPSCNTWTSERPTRWPNYPDSGKVCTYISKHFEGVRTKEIEKGTNLTASQFYCRLRSIATFDTQFVMHYLLLPIPTHPAGCENWGSIYIDLTTIHHSQTNGVYLHEIAHYWFGNVITPVDWKHLWVSEGLVTWITYWSQSIYGRSAAEAVYYAGYYFNTYFYTPSLDPRASRRTVVDEHWAQGLSSEHVMPLVYLKGSMIIFMLQSVLGEPLFHKCLREFLLKYHYNTPVNTQQMLDSFQSSIGDFRKGWDKTRAMNVTEFLAPYIYFYNHTTIQVVKLCQPKPTCQATSYEIVRIDPPDTPEHFVWHTPVWIRDNRNLQLGTKMEWIEGAEPKLGISSSNITINPETFGFYELQEDDNAPAWTLPPTY